MATKATKAAETGVPMTNENLMAAARNAVSMDPSARISTMTQDELAAVYDQMESYEWIRNAMEGALVSQIGMQTVDSVAWRNPVARAKKDPMYYGRTDQEIYINFAKSRGFNPRDNYEAAFAIYQSYVMSMFHTVNFNEQYPFTLSWDNFRNAFQSKYGIRDLIRGKVESAISGYNWDEYNAMVGLIGTGYDKQILPAESVTMPVDQDTSNALIAKVKEKVGIFAFPLPENNIAGATSHSQPTELMWLVTPQVNAVLGTYSNAYAFNREDININVQTIPVHSFGDPAIIGCLVDARFFRVRDQFKRFTTQELATSLNWNHFYTVSEMISASPFYPICVFTTDTVATPTTITASAQTYTAGGDNKIVASVTGGTGTYHIGLMDYEIVSGAVDGTYIVPGTNILHCAPGQTGTIVVKISYREDSSVTTNVNFTAAE